MRRTTTSYSRLGRAFLARFSTSAPTKSGGNEKIIASVLFERLPVVVPKIDPVVYAFQEFSFRWRQQYRREYPESFLKKADARGKGDYQIDFTPASRITEADKKNDRRSLQRALDRRLYLLLYGTAYGSSGNPVWHFPEKVYESEQTLRKCAESALKSVIGDLSHTYFVGNAPMGHMIVLPPETEQADSSSFKRFVFKSQVIAADEFNVGKCQDYVWVTKDELLEYFPDQAQFLNKMIIS
ncbi:uncharacterized protein LOC127255009 [Andrographis paniculata]|uniref:uncharacterized protein LOC127255009 n=1 Tax=Andrographis paniculata TaxID=175694 RepID=UPI0021E803AE|nr:uncharacterized protein LOC127255009 [Andrographis paniculata]